MKIQESLSVKPLQGSVTEKRLSSLRAIYEKLAGAQLSFSDTADKKDHRPSCAKGCGECCRNFIPDILQAEAEAIALYLFSERPELIPRLEFPTQSCPFIDDGNPEGLCAIYPIRPLVCRLFGFSGTTGKDGEPEFSLCRHMKPLEGIAVRRFRGSGPLVELFGSIPPVMGHFSTEASSIDPDSCERVSLPEAVSRAMSKIGLESALLNQSA